MVVRSLVFVDVCYYVLLCIISVRRGYSWWPSLKIWYCWKWAGLKNVKAVSCGYRLNQLSRWNFFGMRRELNWRRKMVDWCHYVSYMGLIICTKASRDSDWLWAGRPRGRSSNPAGGKTFLFPTASIPVLGPTQPPIQWVPGVLSPGVKRSGREADHSPPTSVEVKKTWIYTFTPPYVFMAECLIS
jgi:hypothetical protein